MFLATGIDAASTSSTATADGQLRRRATSRAALAT